MMLASTSTDQELVAAARQGDDRSFEELYARYRPRIRGYIHGLTRDHDRAEDITQEVFISALRRIRENDRPISFRPWVYEIARNACIDEYRRSKRAREVPIEEDGSADYAGVRTAPAPEEAVEAKQRLDDLRSAFRGLSERHHKVIVLRELEGRSYNEIASTLGMSKVIVESTLFRARRRLTEEYEDLSTGRRCEYVQRLIAGAELTPVKRLGQRDRRALSRHLEHCRSCRLEARVAGITEHDDWSVRRVSKVAVLLPVPLLKLSRRIGAKATSAARSIHGTAVSSSIVSTAPYAASPLSGAGRAAVAAATLLVAVGGGFVAGGETNHHGAGSSSVVAVAPSAGRPAAGRLGHASPRNALAGASRMTRVSNPGDATGKQLRVLARLPSVTPGAAQSRSQGISSTGATSSAAGKAPSGAPTGVGVANGFPSAGLLPGAPPTAATNVSVPSGTLTSSSTHAVTSAVVAVDTAGQAAGELSGAGGKGSTGASGIGSLVK